MKALSVFALVVLACFAAPVQAGESPNMVLIYGDDVGYGDVGCYGGSISTPNIDALAEAGLRLTDAHCAAATCTPSRYSLLTGRYSFRHRKSGVAPGDAKLIIDVDRTTLADCLQSAGYTAGVVGKWHLGLGDSKIDWNGNIAPGPNQLGFDYHFLIPATGDRVPCVYVEQGRVVDLDPADPITVSYRKPVGDDPTGRTRPDLLKQQFSHGHDQTIVNGISRIGYMAGGHQARWVDEDMADVLTEKAKQFIQQNHEQPFFLYFSTHDIHVPRVPHSRFAESTGHGPRGDAMAQLDWCVGEITAELERLGLSDNTLIIFSSDNGPVLDDGYEDQANERLVQHRPAGDFRGGKYSKFEAGTRVPTIVKWPGHVDPGTTSDALVGQVDWAASLAALVGSEIPEGALPDSRNQLPALLGDDPVGRPHLVEAANGLSLRQGKWKYIPPGTTREQLGPWRQAKIDAPGALYDVSADPEESNNLAAASPDRVSQMAKLLQQIEASPDASR